MIVMALLSFLSSASAYKFLAYNPQFANSHVNFVGKITDTLIDAGHDVVVLSPIFNSYVGGPGTKRARVIELPQSKAAREYEDWANSDGGIITTAWESPSVVKLLHQFDTMGRALEEQCKETYHHPGLLEQLSTEKFDVAYTETMDICGLALFYALGIEKVAVTNSMSIFDAAYYMTHVPTFLSYTPNLMSGHYTDEMTFAQRVENVFGHIAMRVFDGRVSPPFQRVFEELHPGIPDLHDLMASASLIFHNSEPLTDFPHLSSAKNIDIGGIVVSNAHKQLNQTWSDIMNLRSTTILISFGTFAKTYLMPHNYKMTIRETVKRFPDVTFIWKYEKPEHNISRGIPNLIESTWVPQKDMLYDGRLTAFVTHCGQGSTMEANNAGVPLVVIPIASDQIRNANTVKRNGLGVVLDKTLLSAPGPLEEAIREVTSSPKYAEKATRIARMLNQRPFTPRETFVRHMEFLAEHGPLRQLDHYGAKLNFFQFYLLDILAFFLVLAAALLLGLFVITRWLFNRIRASAFLGKQKHE